MKPPRGVASLAICLLGLIMANSEDGFFGETGKTEVKVLASNAAAAEGAPIVNASLADRWQRHDICLEWYTEEVGGVRNVSHFAGEIPVCSTGTLAREDFCPGGEVALAPWWVSRHQGGGVFGPWTQVSGYQCTADIIAALAALEWQQMPIAPNTYTTQPATGWAVAELGVVLAVDQNPRSITTTLLGTPVIIRAIPTVYHWSADDGSTWSTTTAGQTWENGGEAFTFARYEHRTTLGLTTTWRGEFSTDGGVTWRDAPGTATTTSATTTAGQTWENGGDAFTFARYEHRTTLGLTTTWRGEFSTDGGVTWRDAPGTATTTSATTTVHVYHPHTHTVACTTTGNCTLTTSGQAGATSTLLDPDGDGTDNYLIPDSQIDAYLAARTKD